MAQVQNKTYQDSMGRNTGRSVTDSRGNANANQILSQRRADSVRDALIAAGVASGRMTSVGLGEDNAVADNETEEGRAKNRRVDVILEDAPR